MRTILLSTMLMISSALFSQVTILNGRKKEEIKIRMSDFILISDKQKIFTDPVSREKQYSSTILYKNKNIDAYLEYWIDSNDICITSTIMVLIKDKNILIEAISNAMGADWFLGENGMIVWYNSRYSAGGVCENGMFKVTFFSL